MGDFRKKMSCRLISKEKNSYTEKKYLSWCIRLEKNPTPVCVRRKNSITRGGEKNSYPRQIFIALLPPTLKSQTLGPSERFNRLASLTTCSYELSYINGGYYKLLLVFIRINEERPIERYKARVKVQKEHRALHFNIQEKRN